MKNFKHLITALFLFTAPMISSAQIINTIAGNGVASFSGDGGQATDAELWGPQSIFVDKTGNLFIPEYLSNRVRKVNASGIITTIAGNGYGSGGSGGYSGDGGMATDAELNKPQSICTDALGDVYIADPLNDRIRMVNTVGIITTIAGNGFNGFYGDGGAATTCEFSNVGSICFDASSNLYVTDIGNHRVRKINTAGIITTIVGGGSYFPISNGMAATSVSFESSAGVVVDDTGNIYVSAYNAQQVFKVNKAGNIYIIAGNGKFGYSGDGGPATAAELYVPLGLCLDGSDNLYIGDGSNCRIRKINHSTGIITTVAGNGNGGFSGDGGQATAAELSTPGYPFIDALGNLYIADDGNSRIRQVKNITGIGITSVSDKNDFTIFPNPANQQLTINFNRQITQGLATLSILDITGRELVTYPILLNANDVQVNVSSLIPGMYFISIKSKEISTTQKFIKY